MWQAGGRRWWLGGAAASVGRRRSAERSWRGESGLEREEMGSGRVEGGRMAMSKAAGQKAMGRLAVAAAPLFLQRRGGRRIPRVVL